MCKYLNDIKEKYANKIFLNFDQVFVFQFLLNISKIQFSFKKGQKEFLLMLLEILKYYHLTELYTMYFSSQLNYMK